MSKAAGREPFGYIVGTDYPTTDGTAIRDYVHIADLAEAHVPAPEHSRRGGESDLLDLATGDGYSMMEVIETARKVPGKPIPIKNIGRRAGDPPKLLANARKAGEILKWKSVNFHLEAILGSQSERRQRHPRGHQQ